VGEWTLAASVRDRPTPEKKDRLRCGPGLLSSPCESLPDKVAVASTAPFDYV
jgi:hypothetical protein